MIQRIQSLFLLIAVVLLTLLSINEIMAGGIACAPLSSEIGDSPILCTYSILATTVLVALSALASFVSIFLFKKRKCQIKLCYTAVALILLFYIIFAARMMSGGSIELCLVSGRVCVAVLPAVALLFILLAIRAIKADEKLIKSLDRIR